MAWEVKCIRESGGSLETITHLGGDGWSQTVEEVVIAIGLGGEFYTNVAGRVARLEVAESAAGRKYVRTKGDDSKADNLLSLPRCR